MTPANNASIVRYYHLDALRAGSLILGIVGHGTLPMMENFLGHWPARDRSSHISMDIIAYSIHGFRMQLFFALAGFFANLVVTRKGMRAFVSKRMKRIVLPFIISQFTLIPLCIVLWHIGFSLDPYRTWPVAFSQHVPLFHLWFLWFLIIYYVGAFAASTIFAYIRHRLPFSFKSFRPNHLLAYLLLAVPVASLVLAQRIVGLEEQGAWIPNPTLLAYYACFFIWGWFLFTWSHLFEKFAQSYRVSLLVAVIALIITLWQLLSSRNLRSELEPHNGIVLALTYCTYTLAMIVGVIGAAVVHGSLPHGAIKYLVDASYWCYLSHLPIIVWLQILIAQMPVAAVLKLPLVCFVTLAICLLTFDRLVRFTWVGKALNGELFHPQ
jgi:glucans biosynthesis protein C